MNVINVLIFAGTTEGRKLIESVSNGESSFKFYVSVATDYGKSLLPKYLSNVDILSGRLSTAEIVDTINKYNIDLVIDATHPYAIEVTKNIKEACNLSKVKYLRLLRETQGLVETNPFKVDQHGTQARCIYVKDTEEAVNYLNKTEGNVLLTTGSKELEAYTTVRNYKERIFPRVLPTTDVVTKCWELGFEAKQLICMQGPFSYEMNLALLKQIKASYLVTKETGNVGGFYEKCQAALEAGVNLVMIRNNVKESGLTLDAVLTFLKNEYGFKTKDENNNFIESKGMWFPLFIKFVNKRILIVGAGSIASRRISTLLQFNCTLKVIAKEAQPLVMQAKESCNLELLLKEYEEEDLQGIDLVVAATDNRLINHEIYEDCKRNGIMVNIADCKEECDFYFPGIIRNGDITVGITAEGKNHSMAKEATTVIRKSIEKLAER